MSQRKTFPSAVLPLAAAAWLAILPSSPAGRPHLEPALFGLRNSGTILATGLRPRTLETALRAFRHAVARGEAAGSLVTIVDYELPSTMKRLWVLDLASGTVLFHELVAHGKGTGDNLAQAFSNLPGSNQSSLGAFLTGATYTGKHGLSLRLHGLEAGINDLAAARAIVIHGADYVSHEFAQRVGRLGRSEGCPALGTAVAARLIRAIAGGSFLFAYYPDPTYERSSAYLAAAADQ